MPTSGFSASPLIPTERELRSALRQHAADGQWFLAYDVARQGMDYYPNVAAFRQEAAHALINLGAIAEAEKILLPISPEHDPDDARFLGAVADMRAAVVELVSAASPGDGVPPNSRHTAAVVKLLEAADISRKLRPPAVGGDEETLGLLGRVSKEFWRETRDPSDARRCRDMYKRAFAASGGYWSCINVATMTRVLAREPGDCSRDELLAESRDYARLAIRKCEQEAGRAVGDDLFWLAATCGEARLLVDDQAGAVTEFRRARSYGPRHHGQMVSVRRQLTLLSNAGVNVPGEALALFSPPAVICFSGHMIDMPGRRAARFPAKAEKAVRAAIDCELDNLGESIGYASAACGSDILFLEAMLEREAEVNIVLPFKTDDFIQTSVRFAGERWVRRFRQILKLAGNRVFWATTEPYLNSEDLFQFGNNVMLGLGRLRARSLETLPQLLAVVDPTAEAGANGTAAVIASAAGEPRLRVIDLGEIRRSLSATPFDGIPAGDAAPSPEASAPASPRTNAHGLTRAIKTFLFADVKGYSALTELQIPLFIFEFLRALADRLRTLPVQPQLVETWGDGLYVVMPDAMSMVQYALALQDTVSRTDWSLHGLPSSLNMRIGLHAGPAYEGIHPLTMNRSFFGSHVSRAARIEPITLPGHIYATMQFVALLSAERAAAPEVPGGLPISCEYLGQLTLAKDIGDMPLYHIRPRYGDQGRRASDVVAPTG